MELKGTTAVITGSSGRLGGAIAKALADVGCDCICHYHRNRQQAEQIAEQIRKSGVNSQAVKADLTGPGGIDKLFAKAVKFGVPQILINSAAVFSRRPLQDVTSGEAQKVFNLNLTAPILASKVFAGLINARFPNAQNAVGKIINIADVGGIRPWAEYILYCASKAGLIGATRSLAKELAPAVCVNSVAVGLVNWPDDFDQAAKDRQLSFIPAAGIGQPNDVTSAIIFLLKNDYITGQVLNVDGGRVI